MKQQAAVNFSIYNLNETHEDSLKEKYTYVNEMKQWKMYVCIMLCVNGGVYECLAQQSRL